MRKYRTVDLWGRHTARSEATEGLQVEMTVSTNTIWGSEGRRDGAEHGSTEKKHWFPGDA